MRVRRSPDDDDNLDYRLVCGKTHRPDSSKVRFIFAQQYYDRHPPAVYSQYSKRGKIMTNAELNTFLDLEWNCAAYKPEETSVSAPISPTQWARILSRHQELH